MSVTGPEKEAVWHIIDGDVALLAHAHYWKLVGRMVRVVGVLHMGC
jgi:hypothetical protein